MGGHFDMEVWYNDMVETFEDDPEDPKAVSIIHHWNVFVVFVCIDLSNSNIVRRCSEAARLERRRARDFCLRRPIELAWTSTCSRDLPCFE